MEMKIISFSCVEKLPALLDWAENKKPWQTIRPAWNQDAVDRNNSFLKRHRAKEFPVFSGASWAYPDPELKPPYLEVGDPVKLMWKQRGTHKDALFCRQCGEPIQRHRGFNEPCSHIIKVSQGTPNMMETDKKYIFPKPLGIGKVTEVFKIEMGFTTYFDELDEKKREVFYVDTFDDWPEGGMFRIHHLGTYRDELAKRDGIGKGTLREFIDYFSKNYDFSIPKPFYVYRGSWLSEMPQECK